MKNFDGIVEKIRQERQKQIEKWGDNNPPIDTMLRVTGEEYGEACQAINNGDVYGYRDEMIQVAACAVKAIQAFDNGSLYTDEQLEKQKLLKEIERLKGLIRDAHIEAG